MRSAINSYTHARTLYMFWTLHCVFVIRECVWAGGMPGNFLFHIVSENYFAIIVAHCYFFLLGRHYCCDIIFEHRSIAHRCVRLYLYLMYVEMKIVVQVNDKRLLGAAHNKIVAHLLDIPMHKIVLYASDVCTRASNSRCFLLLLLFASNEMLHFTLVSLEGEQT